MDRMYEELEDAKAEIEKLKADYRIKAELSESLKRSHNEQLNKNKELSLKIEKQAAELCEKDEEISSVKQMYEDTRSRLNEKEGIIRSLVSANERLRADSDGKLKDLVEEKREWGRILDEANEKNTEQEQKICKLKEEIEGVKGVLSVSQRKLAEAEKQARAPKDSITRYDMLLTLEEETVKVKDELKWKKEQFKHLEDAHENLKERFRARKNDWELEKSKLFDGLCSLETSLQSQVRISEDLQKQLTMCNQTLAHEESRRKYLEVQLSESKMSFENVYSECQEAKSKIEDLTFQRDNEIAALRNSLGTKGILNKELEYKLGRLEQENQDLRGSLKELQEAQIHDAGKYSSLGKLKSKLRSLEQVHKGCSENLRAKEEEWNFEKEKLSRNLNDCISEVKSINLAILELNMELDCCHSSIMQLSLQNEESSLILLVLKSEFPEAMSRINARIIDMESHDREREQHISHLMEQLELKDIALMKAQKAIEEGSENPATSVKRVDEDSEQANQVLQTELEWQKKTLEESFTYQIHLKEQAQHMRSDFEEKLNEVLCALDVANSELDEKICLSSEMEFELQIWKSTADRLKVDLEENHEKCREVEASLLAQVQLEETLKERIDSLVLLIGEKDETIDALEQQIDCLKQEVQKTKTKAESMECLSQELKKTKTLLRIIESERVNKQEQIDNLVHVVEEKGQNINALQQQIEALNQEVEKTRAETRSMEFEHVSKQQHSERLQASETAKLDSTIPAQIEAEKALKIEKEDLLLLVQDKDQKIQHLEQLVKSLEQNFSSFALELEQKQAEVDSICQDLQKLADAEAIKEQEVLNKKLMIAELENDIRTSQTKLELVEDTLFCSRQNMEKIKADLEEKQVEVEELRHQLETKLTTSDASIANLENEKKKLLDDVVKLSSERENMLGFLWDLGDKIGKYSNEDMQLMSMLERIVDTCNVDSVDMDLEKNDELALSTKENLGPHLSPIMKKPIATVNERSPFKELND